MNTDPLAESFISITPYNAMVNNPISYIDPDGRFSTNVTENEDGTHTVAEGGDANDGDNNIYVVDGDGNRTGETIGESLTSHSFFDENDNAVVGAVIDTNSSEGQDFIDNEIIADDPGLVDYMVNATGGEKFDLKDRGIEKAVEGGQTPIQHRYRGSKASNGKIGSARDFGNGAAGIVAARKGLSWSMTRVGFDGLQTFQNRSASWLVAPYAIGEGTPSVLAQKLGFQIGKALNASEGIRLPSNSTVQRFGEY